MKGYSESRDLENRMFFTLFKQRSCFYHVAVIISDLCLLLCELMLMSTSFCCSYSNVVVGGLDWSNSLVCLNPKCSFLWLSFYTVYQKHFFNDVTEHKQYFCISSANSGPPGKWPLNGQRMCVCACLHVYSCL